MLVAKLGVYNIEPLHRARKLGVRAVVQSIGLRLRDWPGT